MAGKLNAEINSNFFFSVIIFLYLSYSGGYEISKFISSKVTSKVSALSDFKFSIFIIIARSLPNCSFDIRPLLK